MGLAFDNIGYFPDTCQVHSHHRGKLALWPLKRHTGIHYSIAGLSKLESMQSCIFGSIEKRVPHKVRRTRIDGPPPAEGSPLFKLLDWMHDFSAEHHKRRKGEGVSTFVSDCMRAGRLLNGPPGNMFDHKCYRIGPSATMCCKDKADTIDGSVVSVVSLLNGTADRHPTENTWTHVLPSFAKTLIRKIILRQLDIDDFFSAEQPVDLDKERNVYHGGDDATVTGEYLKALKGVRVGRANGYYKSEDEIDEVGVLFTILNLIDKKLLYPMLGGVDRKTEPAKLAKFLARDTTLVGDAMEQLSELINHWYVPDNVDVAADQWMISGFLRSPMANQQFMRKARGLTFAMDCAVARRWEHKYDGDQYRPFAIIFGEWSDEELMQKLEPVASRKLYCAHTSSIAR